MTQSILEHVNWTPSIQKPQRPVLPADITSNPGYLAIAERHLEMLPDPTRLEHRMCYLQRMSQYAIELNLPDCTPPPFGVRPNYKLSFVTLPFAGWKAALWEFGAPHLPPKKAQLPLESHLDGILQSYHT